MTHETPKPTRVRTKSPETARHSPKRRRGEPPRAWDPELAGRLRPYPKTPEAHAAHVAAASEQLCRLTAEGRMTRRGVPDGWGGRRDELAAIRASAREEAKGIVLHMRASGIIGEPEDPRAEEALEAVIEVVRARDPATGQHAYSARDRVSAANAVLTFTSARPAASAGLSVQRAEDFLAEVAASVGRDN